jgi:hypothetical protein
MVSTFSPLLSRFHAGQASQSSYSAVNLRRSPWIFAFLLPVSFSITGAKTSTPIWASTHKLTYGLHVASQKSSVTFLSAALRHVRDAEYLQLKSANTSVDQAWHLAGLGIECARKAGVEINWFWKLVGHSFSDQAEAIVDLAIALDPAASRLPIANWRTDYPTIKLWSSEHRYDKSGTHQPAAVLQLVVESRLACRKMSLALLLDGTVNSEAFNDHL